MAHPYEVNKINDGFWAIEEGGVRVYLIEGKERALLIDTGFGTGDLKAEVNALTSKPITLVNTHTDGDHIGCNPQFACAYMHPSEMDYYLQKQEGGDPPNKIKAIWEGQTFDLGGRTMEVVHIPGHTPGSIALLDRETRILFTGDSVSQTPIFMFNPGRNFYAYIASMKKLEGMMDTFDEIYPCHGPLPLSKDIIPTLIVGAEAFLAGKLSGEAPGRDLNALLYKYQNVGFFAKR